MTRLQYYLLALLLCTATLLAADAAQESADKEIAKTILDEEPEEVTEVKPVALKSPLSPVLGEPIKWASGNIDKWAGWSLTGYSWGGLTSDFNPWRFKVGMVGGEWEVDRLYKIQSGEIHPITEWERQMDERSIFGVSFTITF